MTRRIKATRQHIGLEKSCKTGKAAIDEQSKLKKTIGRSNRHQIRPKFNGLLD
jgi:hypothetical protein